MASPSTSPEHSPFISKKLMSTKYIKLLSYSSLIMVTVLCSCIKDEYEQATITFYPTLSAEADEPNVGTDGIPVTINLLTSRNMLEESQVNIKIIGSGAGYGYSYVTNPPMLESGIVTLTIPKGQSKTSFTFTPRNDGIITNDYHYAFVIDGASNGIKSIGQKQFTLTVKEGRLRKYDFNACSGAPAGFTEQIVPGPGIMTSTTWGCTTFGYNTTSGIEANAFGSNKSEGTCNSYLVMDVIDAKAYSTFYASVQVYSHFSGPGTIKIKYSTNYAGSGNPEAESVVWTDFAEMNSQLPAAGSRTWKTINGKLENVNADKLYFAIHFTGATKSSSANWRVDNFELKAE
jgi:hypothetical protein